MRKNTIAEFRRFKWLQINRPKTIIYGTVRYTDNWHKFRIGKADKTVFEVNGHNHLVFYYQTKRPHRRIVLDTTKE